MVAAMHGSEMLVSAPIALHSYYWWPPACCAQPVEREEHRRGHPTDHLISFSVAPVLNGYSQPAIHSLFERMRGTGVAAGVRAVFAAQEPVLSA